MAFVLRTLGLFTVTTAAEIVGCYLPYLYLRQRASPFALIPAALSLFTFAWLLSLHPGAAGRTYAAYGGVYVSVALVWLSLIDGQRPDQMGRTWSGGNADRNVDNRFCPAWKVEKMIVTRLSSSLHLMPAELQERRRNVLSVLSAVTSTTELENGFIYRFAQKAGCSRNWQS